MKKEVEGVVLEFLLVGESKLKIVISDEEMREYKLEAIVSESDSQGCRRGFWRVLDLAKKEVGFDPAGDKVLVQFYPMKGGGCEVFVTKLGILTPSSAKMVSKSDKVAMFSRRKSFYFFESLDNLILALEAVRRKAKDALPDTDVYISEKHGCFLSVEECMAGGEPAEFPCILEFGRMLAADFSLYVSEHFHRVTSGDAIVKFCGR